MELNNDFTIASSVDEAWPVLTDLSRVAPCMPGATLDSVDGNAFTGRMAIKLGPMSLAYRGEGRISPDDDAHSIVLDVAGGEQRGGGKAAARITAVLEPLSADRTRVRVVSDLELSGKPAQFGRGILVDVAGRLLSTFATNLESELRATPLEPASTGAGTAAASAAGTEQLDLGAAALAPMLKRVAPVVLGTIVVGFVVRQLVRRWRN